MDNQELNLIAQQVNKRKEHLIKEGLPVPEKEKLVKEVLGEQIEKEIKNVPPVKAEEPEKEREEKIASSLSYPESITSVVNPDIQHTLKELTEIALEKGIKKAISLARKTGNAFILDTFRDELAGKYYAKLKELKLL